MNLSFAKSASAELELPINMKCRFYCLYLLLCYMKMCCMQLCV